MSAIRCSAVCGVHHYYILCLCQCSCSLGLIMCVCVCVNASLVHMFACLRVVQLQLHVFCRRLTGGMPVLPPGSPHRSVFTAGEERRMRRYINDIPASISGVCRRSDRQGLMTSPTPAVSQRQQLSFLTPTSRRAASFVVLLLVLLLGIFVVFSARSKHN